MLEPAVLNAAAHGATEHYNEMLAAAHARDLPRLRALAQQAHPVCVASGAAEGTSRTARGVSDARCGTRTRLPAAPRAPPAGRGARQLGGRGLLVLSLVAETVGMVPAAAGEAPEAS